MHVRQDSSVDADMGCDATFTADTLCLTQVWVQHPYLEGADGFVMDTANNLWVDANERNAVIFVFNPTGEAVEVFRNPVDMVTRLRNAGPLETPTSPVLGRPHALHRELRRQPARQDSPSTDGEIGGPNGPRARSPASTSACRFRPGASGPALRGMPPGAVPGAFQPPMPYHFRMKVIGIARYSGSGRDHADREAHSASRARQGLRVSLVKHAHHEFDVDQPGKDSYRHRHAGCSEVLVGSSRRWALMHELRGAEEPTLSDSCASCSPATW